MAGNEYKCQAAHVITPALPISITKYSYIPSNVQCSH